MRRHLTHGADSPSSPEEPDRRERSLAIARIFLAASLYIAALFAPSPWPLAKQLLFGGYVVFSVAVLVVLRRAHRPVNAPAMVHAIDMLAAAGMTTLTGPGSPFVLAVLFPLAAAAHRWGFRATMTTAAAVAVLLATPAVLAAMGAVSFAGLSQPGAGKLLATRAALILITGVILGTSRRRKDGFGQRGIRLPRSWAASSCDRASRERWRSCATPWSGCSTRTGRY